MSYADIEKQRKQRERYRLALEDILRETNPHLPFDENSRRPSRAILEAAEAIYPARRIAREALELTIDEAAELVKSR